MNQNATKYPVLLFIKIWLKKFKYWIFPLLIIGLWAAYEVLIARPAMTYMGLPQIMSGVADKGWSHVLRNEGYMLEYSESLANPLWVTYFVDQKRFKPGKRPKFSSDWRSLKRVSHKDYSRSGYDRGHMAPNYVIASRYGQKAQKETFLMTNISPQKSRLNQKSWQRLEEVIANDFSQWYGGFWVVTGPIFDEYPDTIKETQIAIPKAFYKILIKPSETPELIMALAFIFPQTARPNASLMTFVTSIDEVEKQTGIDFFSALEDDVETELEKNRTPQQWRLDEVANRPARY